MLLRPSGNRFDRTLKKFLIASDNLIRRPVGQERPVLDQENRLTEPANSTHVMGYKDYGLPPLAEVVDPRRALLLKRGVAHGQNFVDQQDVGIHLRGNRKSQPHKHAARILLDWRVDEVAQFRKIQDLLF